MIRFDNDSEIMEFTEQIKNNYKSWCKVELRKPKTESRPYNTEKHSVYLTMWAGERTGIYLTANQARKIATWLICAAEIIDERNNE